jgi:hypothetical protein
MFLCVNGSNPTVLSLQENVDLVAAIFPHKILNSARKCIFTGGINLPLNRMPVNFLAEISANNFVNSARNF